MKDLKLGKSDLRFSYNRNKGSVELTTMNGDLIHSSDNYEYVETSDIAALIKWLEAVQKEAKK